VREGVVARSTDDAVLTVEFIDTTEHHLGLRGGHEILEKFPQDSNPAESSALLSEITGLAQKLGAQLRAKEDRVDPPVRRQHYDGGIDWTVVQSILTMFASGGAGWLFLKRCESLLLQWQKNQALRSIRVKHEDWEIEIHGRNDLDQVLEALRQYSEGQEKGDTTTQN
jgi:hypothetical protein